VFPDPIILHIPDHVKSNMLFGLVSNIGAIRFANAQKLLFDAGFFCFAFYLFDQCRVIGVYQAHDFFQIAIAAAQHLNRGPEFLDACINQQQPV
jgi:hypothetical protein